MRLTPHGVITFLVMGVVVVVVVAAAVVVGSGKTIQVFTAEPSTSPKSGGSREEEAPTGERMLVININRLKYHNESLSLNKAI